MKVVVKLFAAARDLAGQQQVAIELPANASVGGLRRALLVGYPALSPLLPHSLFAIDNNYVTDETAVVEGSEIACIPPVSGG